MIEVRSGFNPDAVLAELYRLTPMEETFGINNVALVDGQPRVLGLRELLEIYVAHRLEVMRRRTEYRRRKRPERLHLVDGLLVALLNIDEVIQVIRSSDDAAAARERLMTIFELSEIQAQYILDTPLRRLTRYDRLELEREQDTLRAEIAALTAILESEARLREVVGDELAEVAKKFGTPRRTVLLEGGAEAPVAAAVPLEVTDDPCVVLMSATGLVAGWPSADADIYAERTLVPPAGDLTRVTARRARRGGPDHGPGHDRGGHVGRAAGQGERAGAARAAARRGRGVAGRRHAGERVRRAGAGRDGGRAVLGRGLGAGVALGTADGRGQAGAAGLPAEPGRVRADRAASGDRVVGAVPLSGETDELVFITSDAQLLRFPAASVRPQGRAAGGMAGVRLAAGRRWCGSARWTRPRRPGRRRARRGPTPPRSW